VTVTKFIDLTARFIELLDEIDISGKENLSNKQNSLAVDGTNTKNIQQLRRYPAV
jgi:hypothetical protein